MRRVASLAALAGAALLSAALPAGAEPTLWVLRDADSTVTLLPSVHALPPGVTWRGPRVNAALAEAEVIVFEFDQAPSAAARGAAADRMAALGRAELGAPLASRLTREGRARLSRQAQSLGFAPGALAGLRPWYALFLLDQAAARRDGARLSLGVEAVLAASAGPRRLEALERAEEVAAALAAMPDAEALSAIEALLSDLERPNRRTREHALERAWAQGRLGPVIAAVAEQAERAPRLHARLVTDRNRRWAAQVAALLAREEDVLVVVGAAHFVGPDGLPSLLRARGLPVQGP